MKPVILHLMGPTCAGKSTVINKLLELAPEAVYPVQIGKILRAKYGEAHFKGQAAPANTKDEALALYFSEIERGIELDCKLIIIDGQPRDLEQAQVMMAAWEDDEVEVRWLLLTADHEDREKRARLGRTGADLDLALARLVNDYRNNYIVLAELLSHGEWVGCVNTSARSEPFDVDHFCAAIINEYVGEGELLP